MSHQTTEREYVVRATTVPLVPPIAPKAVPCSPGLQQELNYLTSVDNGEGYLFQLPQMCLHVQLT